MDGMIFLEGYRGKKSVSTSSGVRMGLVGKRRLLPFADVDEVVSQNDVYNEERGGCSTIRLTCQVNPVCSNVLFNSVSEIVRDEGSDRVTVVNYGVSGSTRNPSAKVSDNVRYKQDTMKFWSGGSMSYQSTDKISSDDPSKGFTSRNDSLLTTLYDNGQVNGIGGHPTNAIRDTQLSNDGYVYHCGMDIFNNHLIRSNTFKVICKCANKTPGNDAFNTIADVMRDVEGRKVIEIMPFPHTANVPNDAKFVAMHTYQYDDVYTFDECVSKRLRSRNDGWLGFYNRSKIKSYETFSVDHTRNDGSIEEELGIERPLMYVSGGDFVNMYPDRNMYSFVPRYNKYRNRYEANWNYCVTYPSSSTTDGFDDIIDRSSGGLKAIYFNENTRADNGVRQLVIYGISKHGLVAGDHVNVYITSKEGGLDVSTRVIEGAEVSEVVDDYIFTVFGGDVQISDTWVQLTEEELYKDTLVLDGIGTFNIDRRTRKYYYKGDSADVKYYIINNEYVNFDPDAQRLSYRKTVGGVECDYYVRIFSKVPNFKYASADTRSEYEIYKDKGRLIWEYQDKKYDFESVPSRLAFAKNIYSDEVGEVVFTDDIDIANLRDNLGRPLTSLYLTLVKNNRGYKEWYGFNYAQGDWDPTEVTSDYVEFSHCFGSVKCGISTSEEATVNGDVNSIFRVNAEMPYGYDVSRINGHRDYKSQHGKTITVDDYEVWFDKDRHYYGDLCCYDNYTAFEQSIQPILHRVNTAQRESSRSWSNQYFQKFAYDEITSDDYDASEAYTIEVREKSGVNRKNEGYYYCPHYEIPIRSLGKMQSVFPDFLSIRSVMNTEEGARIVTLQRHFLSVGDKAMLYDSENDRYYHCVAVSGSGDSDRVFTCKIYDESGNEAFIDNLYGSSANIGDFKLFKMDNLDIPSYASILRDGSCRLIWRDVINNGMGEGVTPVEEYPFTNGALYVNKRVDLYMRRQDPYALYGLYSEDDLIGESVDYEDEDNYVEEDDIEC